MKKKELYASPQTEVLELSYAEPVCQATSTNAGVPDIVMDGYLPGWESIL